VKEPHVGQCVVSVPGERNFLPNCNKVNHAPDISDLYHDRVSKRERTLARENEWWSGRAGFNDNAHFLSCMFGENGNGSIFRANWAFFRVWKVV